MSEQDSSDKPPTTESNDSNTDDANEQEAEAPELVEPTEENDEQVDGEQVDDDPELAEQNKRTEQEPDNGETAPPLTEGTEEEPLEDDAGTEGVDEEGADEDGEAGEGDEQPFPPDLERHVFEGEFNPNGNPVGYHHREGGVDQGDFTVDEDTKTETDRHGVYEAEWTGTAPDGTEAGKNSSFFPDSYSQEDVRDSVREAFDNRTAPSSSNPRLWEGTTSDGMRIQGYVGPGKTVADATEDDIKTAFPVWEGRFLL